MIAVMCQRNIMKKLVLIRTADWRVFCILLFVLIYLLDRVISPVCHVVRSTCIIKSVASVFAFLFIFSSVALARLNGDASLTYSKYDGSNGTSASSSSSLVQSYSLLYASGGPIYNSRVGHYNISLGYSLHAIDSTFKSSGEPDKSYKEPAGKLLYLGEMKVDPKEIPFRLNAYSRDMSGITVKQSDGTVHQKFNSIIGGYGQAIGVSNDIHIESGVTLIAGVKNGMTNGYNELLRHLPMILIDYKDTINRGKDVDNRLNRLAFVSLNKKDNWFHYRHTQYVDNLDSFNSYDENQFQLGTVDQYMARRWIDFSNWIKVSTDLQLSTRKNTMPPNQIEEINLNMFVSAERKAWNARTFTSFSRSVDESKRLTYQKSVPLYVSGFVSTDTSWNARASYQDNREIGVAGAAYEYSSMLAGYRVNTFKRSPFTLSHSFDVESTSSDTTDSLTFSGALETYSSSLFSKTVQLAASYNVRSTTYSSVNIGTDSTTSNTNSDSLMQQLVLKAGYFPSNNVRFELSQINNFNKGTQSSFGGESQLGAFGTRVTNSSDSNVGSYSSNSSLSAYWTPKPRLSISLSLNESVSKTDVQSRIDTSTLTSSISYINSVWDVKNKFDYSHGNSSANAGDVSTASNTTTLKYIHSRNFSSNASAAFSSSSSQGESSRTSSFGQGVNYTYFTTNGVTRPLFELNETLTYSGGKPRSINPSKNAIALGFRYYPISRLTLAGGVAVGEFRFSEPFNDTLVWNTSVAANFKLLNASVDYVSAFRNTDKVREKKLTGNIRKSF